MIVNDIARATVAALSATAPTDASALLVVINTWSRSRSRSRRCRGRGRATGRTGAATGAVNVNAKVWVRAGGLEVARKKMV